MDLNCFQSSKCEENAGSYKMKIEEVIEKEYFFTERIYHDSSITINSIRKRTDCSGTSPNLPNTARAILEKDRKGRYRKDQGFSMPLLVSRCCGGILVLTS